MSAALSLLARCQQHGLEFVVSGERLKMRAAAPPPDDLIAEVRQHKPELIAALTSTVARPTVLALYGRVFAALQGRRPDQIEYESWQRAIEDGRRFLAEWGEQAAALRWTDRDLLGLHPIPQKPLRNYQRLSRYDETGLIWLLRGQPVLALTEGTAAIKSTVGTVTIYRRLNKPALGPLGDSLDELR
jgi:hypothetical protein